MKENCRCTLKVDFNLSFYYRNENEKMEKAMK